MPKQNNVAIDAARIALEIDGTKIDSLNAATEAVRAATALDTIESAPGFDWEDQATDWESVCAALAAPISRGATVKNWLPLAKKAVAGKAL